MNEQTKRALRDYIPDAWDRQDLIDALRAAWDERDDAEAKVKELSETMQAADLASLRMAVEIERLEDLLALHAPTS